MLVRLFFICATILLVSLTTSAAAVETGAWSEVVKGVQGRVIISEDQPFNGTRIVAVHLELRNVSNIGTPVEIYFDSMRTLHCQLVDANGKALATAGLPASILMTRPFWLTLPYESSLRFRISVSGYGIPRNEKALIPLGCGDWVIKSGDVSEYHLEFTFASNPPEVDLDRNVWRGTLKLPGVKISPNNTFQGN